MNVTWLTNVSQYKQQQSLGGPPYDHLVTAQDTSPFALGSQAHEKFTDLLLPSVSRCHMASILLKSKKNVKLLPVLN
jgi:hypothetical protein